MRVLIAAHGFPPNQAAGAEWRAYRTARSLAVAGHDVQVVAVDRTDVSANAGVIVNDAVLDGVPVRRWSLASDTRPGAVDEFDNPRMGAALADVLDAFRPDVLHIISGYRLTASVIGAARAAYVPMVITLTDFWFLCPRISLRRSTGELCTVPDDPLECALCVAGEQRRYRLPLKLLRGRLRRALVALWPRGTLARGHVNVLHSTMVQRRLRMAAALGHVERLIAPSRFLARLFEQHGAARGQVVYMRQGVNSAGWTPVDATPARSAVHIGYIGQIAEHKGIFDLVPAFRSLPHGATQARLLVYGDHEHAWPIYRQRLMHAVGGDARVVVMGPFDNPSVRQIHANLDVLVVPSRWYENSPNVILEAFACGTPVIAANLGGMAELVDDGVNGLLFEPGNRRDLARCLRQMVDDAGLRAKLRAGMPPVRTLEDERAELIELYEEVTRAHRNAQRLDMYAF